MDMSMPEVPAIADSRWREAPPVPGNVVALPTRQAAYADAAAVIRALAPTEPLYLFCSERLDREVRRFRCGFPGLVSYAVKANPHPMFLQGLWKAGIATFDVASLGEVELVRGSYPSAALHFNNPVKSEAEIATAYWAHEVRSFALDDRVELEKIARVVKEPGAVELSVRFKLAGSGAVYDFGTKFGASPGGAIEILREAARRGFRPSLSFHPGSQCTDPDSYVRHIEAGAAIASGAGVVPLRLNVGGGFPVPYVDAAGQVSCADDFTEFPASCGHGPQFSLARYFRVIEDAVARSFPGAQPGLVCEPGRALAAPSASLLCRVKHRREEGSLFLNDGIYGGFMEQILVPLALPVRVWRGDRPLGGRSRPFTVFGPTCDPSDRLPRLVPLPEDVDCGDWVEFGLLGAYGSATATRFNGYRSEHYVEVAQGF